MPDGKPVIGSVPGLQNLYLVAGHEGGGLSMVRCHPNILKPFSRTRYDSRFLEIVLGSRNSGNGIGHGIGETITSR